MHHQGFTVPKSLLDCAKAIHDKFLYGENFVMLSGDSGSGRTSLCEQVVNELESKPENARLGLGNIVLEKAPDYNFLEQSIKVLSSKLAEETQTRTDNFRDYHTGLKNLEKKFEDLAPIETLTTDATTTLNLAKEALDNIQGELYKK